MRSMVLWWYMVVELRHTAGKLLDWGSDWSRHLDGYVVKMVRSEG